MAKNKRFLTSSLLELWRSAKAELPIWITKVATDGVDIGLKSLSAAKLYLYSRRINLLKRTGGANHRRQFQNNPTPIWIFDVATLKILNANKTALESYGYTAEEINGMTIRDIHPPATWELLDHYLENPTNPDTPDMGIWQHQNKAGDIFYARVFTQITLYKGIVSRMLVAVNVDLQIRHEQVLTRLNDQTQDRNLYLESLLDKQSRYFVLRLSLDGKYTYLNRALCERIGLPASSLLGTSAFEGIPEQDAHAAKAVVALCIKNIGESYSLRIHRQLMDGAVVVSDYELVALPNAQGEAFEIQCMGIEVTEKLQYLEELTHYKSQLEMILASITDGFYALDCEWRFTYLNTRMAEMLNSTIDAPIGRTFWEYVRPSLKDVFEYNFNLVVEKNTSVRFDVFLEKEQLWLTVNAYPYSGGVSVFWKDITDQKNDALRVVEQNAILKDIAWVQSHKVRAPLAHILGLISIFNKTKPDDPFNFEVLDLLDISAKSLDTVIREVVLKSNQVTDRALVQHDGTE